MAMELRNMAHRQKGRTGGPNRTPGKPALIAGCESRRCEKCNAFVIVPRISDWRVCTPCRKGWSTPVERGA